MSRPADELPRPMSRSAASPSLSFGFGFCLSLCVGLLLAFGAPAADATRAGAPPRRGLQTGFTDSIYSSSDVAVREAWLEKTVAEHASTIRLEAPWSQIAPSKPPNLAAARDPSWQGYRFGALDEAVAAAERRGLRVLVTVDGAPSWAEGAGRPASAPAGTWEPGARAFGAFATAIATRYGGSFAPPGNSQPLPAVRYWQAWNEPNLSTYLTPQWRRVHGRLRAASVPLYRRMLDAFYRGVHAATHRAGVREQVLEAGTAPYGDPPGGQRIPPARFVRDLLCLTPRLAAMPCPHPAQFDILDHHPYSVRGPFFRAFNRDDVAIANMGKLTRPLRTAERLHLVGGAAHHQVWVTELSWDSDPPDPRGVPVAKQALWLEQALALLYREGVSTVLWFQIVDSPPDPSYATTYQSGTYLLDGAPKPSARAFRFPFVTVGGAGSAVRLWGKSPEGQSPVGIQARAGGRWHTVAHARPNRSGVFRLTLSPHLLLRAVAGSEHSLPVRG